MYHLHPSVALQKAFMLKPFQGVEPKRARYLFVGLDANYAPNIEVSPIFPQLLLYLNDGAAFWRQNGVHHPFMLPAYNGDGRFYHKTFAGIGFRSAHADDVSFVELLHVPTYGKSNLVPDDLHKDHLVRLNQAILHGPSRYVFISDNVARLMRSSGCFTWMPPEPLSASQPLKVWYKTPSKTIYWHYHFSVYGKFHAEKQNQLKAIGNLINS